MTEPVPIRDGVLPEMDVERELLDYFQKEMRLYHEKVGAPPTRVALVLSGKNESGTMQSRTNSWDSAEEFLRTEHCSFASAMLLQRAIGGMK